MPDMLLPTPWPAQDISLHMTGYPRDGSSTGHHNPRGVFRLLGDRQLTVLQDKPYDQALRVFVSAAGAPCQGTCACGVPLRVCLEI